MKCLLIIIVIPLVVTMMSGVPISEQLPESQVGILRNMSMAHSTPILWPMWPVEVSHMVPVEWLGKLHGKKNRCRTLVRGHCGCFGEVKGSIDGGLACSGY